MDIKKVYPQRPWEQHIVALQKALLEDKKILLYGPVGANLVDCIYQIASDFNIKPHFITGTTDTAWLVKQLTGWTQPLGEEHFQRDEQNTKVIEGILVITDVELCDDKNQSLIYQLVEKRTLQVEENTINLHEDAFVVGLATRIYSGVAVSNISKLFNQQIEIPEMKNTASEIPNYLVWYLQKVNNNEVIDFEKEAIDVIEKYEWPGDRQELKKISLLIGQELVNNLITVDMCKRYISPDTTEYLDELRKNELKKIVKGIQYQGLEVAWESFYNWIQQLIEINQYEWQRPWEIGYKVAYEITQNYFINNDQISSLLNNICGELELLKENNKEVIIYDPEVRGKSNGPIFDKISKYLPQNFPGINFKYTSKSKFAENLDNEQSYIVICADDFAGSGKQAAELYFKPISESINKFKTIHINILFLFAVGFHDAKKHLEKLSNNSVEVTTILGRELDERDKIFHQSSQIFQPKSFRKKAKKLLRNIVGKALDEEWPQGYDHTQSLIVFADNVPDNTIPAIYKSGIVRGYKWKPLFKRTEAR